MDGTSMNAYSNILLTVESKFLVNNILEHRTVVFKVLGVNICGKIVKLNWIFWIMII